MNLNLFDSFDGGDDFSSIFGDQSLNSTNTHDIDFDFDLFEKS
jgi:hypothetical protein